MMISRYFSNYLNALRFFSALMVVLFHIKNFELGPPGVLRLIPDHGHDFVIVFFVLSGYLVAYAADNKRALGLREYFLDRGSRIYSVAIPVLLFSVLLSFWHGTLDPVGSFSTSYEQLGLTVFLNLFFLSSIWNLDYLLFWNHPYWSLSYEVVYYAIFGVWFFVRSPYRVWWVLGLMLLVGPKVLLLMPCWLLGVAAYRWRDALRFNTWQALVLGFCVPVLVLYVLHKLGFGPAARAAGQAIFGSYHAQLSWSKDFLVDYMTAVLVALNLYAVRGLRIDMPAWLARVSKYGADMSFSLYLFHQPFLYLMIFLYRDTLPLPIVFAVSVTGALLIPDLLSRVTESKRAWLKAQMARIF